MTNNVTIIIEEDIGRLESDYGFIIYVCKNKKILIAKLKEHFQNGLDNEFAEFNKSISDFEFTIYEDLTEKYS